MLISIKSLFREEIAFGILEFLCFKELDNYKCHIKFIQPIACAKAIISVS